MIPDIFQYFLEHFWNFQHGHQIWPLHPLFITETLQTIQEQIQNILRLIISTYLNIMDFHFVNFWGTDGGATNHEQ